MFECGSCARRLMRAAYTDVLNDSSRLLTFQRRKPPSRSFQAPTWYRQHYNSQASAELHAPSGNEAPPNGEDSAARSFPQNPGSLENLQKEPKPPEFTRKKELEKELLYLRDPLKLAENTINLLRNDQHEKALEVVRAASKRMPCVVSWNHLVDYELSRGRVNSAVKLYNEMKKRAQPPDAHTYTILLRGLAWHHSFQESLPRALKIYHSMSADNCPVKPNIIHTNAVLKVCALARDMDALWGVAAKLPAKGPGAPNNLTFTTILNAIRTVAWQADEDLPDEEPDDKTRRRQRAVMQGRKIWEEIISRWRAGDIWIDEELVCAMGRLLLLGSTERDFDDVLSLAEQVMAVPRQKRPLPAANKGSISDEPSRASFPSLEAESLETNESSPIPETLLASSEDVFPISGEETKGRENQPSPSPSTELMTVFHPKSRDSRISVANPGRNTLSLLLDACINLRAIPSAQSYWGLLTDPSGPYNIAPDSENYHMYLRLLRVQRASKTAVELVEDMATGDLKDKRLIQPKTFRIGMSCCVRDKNNPNALDHANTLLDIMARTLPQPDIRALSMYVNLAGSVPTQDFRVLLGALGKIEPAIKQLKNLVNFSYRDMPYKTKNDVLSLAQLFIGAYDKTFARAGDQLSTKEKQRLNYHKGWLNEWVRRKVQMAVGGPKAKEAEMRGDVVFENKGLLAGGEENAGWGKGERKMAQRAMVDGLEKTRRRTEGGRRKRMERAARLAEESGEYDF